jgi:hypothetical protein
VAKNLGTGAYRLVAGVYDTAIPANLSTTGEEALGIKR